jgi:hypothetical protein
VLLEHVHCIPLCVAVHAALGPHCESDEQVVQLWFRQTWPALHWLFCVQFAQPVGHGAHVSYARHIEMPPVWQYAPRPQSAFEVHGNGFAMATGVHCWPTGQVAQVAVHRPAWHVANAGQSPSDWQGDTQAVVLLPGKTLHTSGEEQATPAHDGGGLGELPSGPGPEPPSVPITFSQ